MSNTELLPRVLFVRHGKQISVSQRKTAREQLDPPLSDTGHFQVIKLGRRFEVELCNERVIIMLSPMMRALQTATASATV